MKLFGTKAGKTDTWKDRTKDNYLNGKIVSQGENINEKINFRTCFCVISNFNS